MTGLFNVLNSAHVFWRSIWPLYFLPWPFWPIKLSFWPLSMCNHHSTLRNHRNPCIHDVFSTTILPQGQAVNRNLITSAPILAHRSCPFRAVLTEVTCKTCFIGFRLEFVKAPMRWNQSLRFDIVFVLFNFFALNRYRTKISTSGIVNPAPINFNNPLLLHDQPAWGREIIHYSSFTTRKIFSNPLNGYVQTVGPASSNREQSGFWKQQLGQFYPFIAPSTAEFMGSVPVKINRPGIKVQKIFSTSPSILSALR